jgi:hypothetical protein
MIRFDEPSSADPEDEFGAELTDQALVYCPYCGEGIELHIDHGGGGVQAYVEDCGVCCQPCEVRVTVDVEGHPHVAVSTLDHE